MLCTCLAAPLRLGVLFHPSEHHSYENIVQIAINDFSSQHQIPAADRPVVVHPKSRTSQDALNDAFTSMCSLLEQGVHSIMGPLDSQECLLLSPVLSWHQMPHVSPLAEATELDQRSLYPYFRRTAPSVVSQAIGMVGIVESLGYSKMGVLYESASAYASSLMHAVTDNFVERGGHIMHVESIPYDNGLITDAALEGVIGRLRSHYVQIICLLGRPGMIERVLKQAQNSTVAGIPVFGRGHLWITSEDSEEMFAHSGHYGQTYERMTLEGLVYVQLKHLVSPASHSLAKGLGVADDIPTMHERSIYDASHSLLTNLYEHAKAKGVSLASLPSYSPALCHHPNGNPYSLGPELLAGLDTIHEDGALNVVNFTKSAADSKYDVVNVNISGGLEVFDGTNPLVFPGGGAKPSEVDLFRGRVLDVLLVEDPPYIEKNAHTGHLEGLFIDFLGGTDFYIGLEKTFDFTVITTVMHGHWSQALDQMTDSKNTLDILIADTVITSEREKTLDFTQPIFDTHTVLLVRKPTVAPVSMWRFKLPFTGDLWGLITLTILIVGASFFIIERGQNEYIMAPDAEGNRLLANAKGLESSIWMSFSSILMNNDGAPVTSAGRVLCCGVFFTSLCLVTTYTAQLTVFLLQQDSIWQVKNVMDFYPGTGSKFMRQLAVADETMESRWVCGQCHCCNASTSVHHDRGLYQEPLFTVDHETAVHRLLTPCAATDKDCVLGILLEANLAKHLVGKHCDLVIHPNGGGSTSVLHLYGLGFALKKFSPFTNAISEEILRLKENGILHQMKQKWVNGHCPAFVASQSAVSSGIKDFAGVFIILACFVGFSLLLKAFSFLVELKTADGRTHPDIQDTESEVSKDSKERRKDDVENTQTGNATDVLSEIERSLQKLRKQL